MLLPFGGSLVVASTMPARDPESIGPFVPPLTAAGRASVSEADAPARRRPPDSPDGRSKR